MKINKQDFLNIKCLIENEKITEGKFKNKDIVEGLKRNGSVEASRRGTIKYINLLREENIFLFLKNYDYNIDSIEKINSYIEDVVDKKASRDVIQYYLNGTKVKDSKSLRGLYVSSLQALDIKLDNTTMSILPQNGVGYFLFYTQTIELFEDTIIVGVENYQVVWFAKQYKEFFSNHNILFVVITPYMLEWIATIKNEYIHFGDCDLAGINIYLNTIVPRLKMSKKYSMFIPKDIEYLIDKHGSSDLYKNQMQFKNLQTDDKEVTKLIKIINRFKKGFEQEGLSLCIAHNL